MENVFVSNKLLKDVSKFVEFVNEEIKSNITFSYNDGNGIVKSEPSFSFSHNGRQSEILVTDFVSISGLAYFKEALDNLNLYHDNRSNELRMHYHMNIRTNGNVKSYLKAIGQLV